MLGENKNVYSENKGEQMEPIKPATRGESEVIFMCIKKVIKGAFILNC